MQRLPDMHQIASLYYIMMIQDTTLGEIYKTEVWFWKHILFF